MSECAYVEAMMQWCGYELRTFQDGPLQFQIDMTCFTLVRNVNLTYFSAIAALCARQNERYADNTHKNMTKSKFGPQINLVCFLNPNALSWGENDALFAAQSTTRTKQKKLFFVNTQNGTFGVSPKVVAVINDCALITAIIFITVIDPRNYIQYELPLLRT